MFEDGQSKIFYADILKATIIKCHIFLIFFQYSWVSGMEQWWEWSLFYSSQDIIDTHVWIETINAQ